MLSLSSFLMKYRQAVEWLGVHGVRTHNNRISEYLSTIEREADQGAISTLGLATMFEAQDLIDVSHVSDGYLRGKHTLEKLRSVGGGDSFYDPATASRADPARNHAFEFIVAAELESVGMLEGFSDSAGDVLARDGVAVRPVECKRVNSPKAIREALRRARSSLGYRRCRSEWSGVVFLDITRASLPSVEPLFAVEASHVAQLSHERARAVLQGRRSDFFNSDRLDKLAVICVCRASSIAVADRGSRIIRNTSWLGVSLPPKGSLARMYGEVFMDRFKKPRAGDHNLVDVELADYGPIR